MKKKTAVILILTFILCQHVTGSSSGDHSAFLTLKDIYSSDYYKSKNADSIKWVGKNHKFTILRKSKEESAIFLSSPLLKKDKLLMKEKELTPTSEKTHIKIEDYTYIKKIHKILIFTNSKKVWRTNSRGDYYLFDLKKRTTKKIGASLPPSSLMFAKFSPDGTRIAYVSKGNIYSENLMSGHILKLTDSTDKNIINGTSDWVYEEEFSLKDGFKWSPDGKHIAFWQFNMKGVKYFFLINNTDSRYSKVIPVQYPKAGETNSACRLGVVNSKGGSIQWLKLEGSLRNNYIPRMWWHPDSKKIYFVRLNRSQNLLKLRSADIYSGESYTVYKETSDSWIELYNGFKWIRKGKFFTWITEFDGWRHIYLISSDGKQRKNLTKGNFDIISLKALDEKRDFIYFTASPDNPTQKYLFRNGLFKNRELKKITPSRFSGNNEYNISLDCKYAFHSYSKFDLPDSSNLVKIPSNSLIKTVKKNKLLKKRVLKIKRGDYQFIKINIGNNIILDAWMMKPWNFNINKKYPVLFYVYGEPWSQTVRDRWGGNSYLWHLMMTQKGFVVISIDNRGTPSPKGRVFRKVIYKKIGILNVDDQAKSAQKLLKTYPYLDSTRVGVWGWSGGGSSTLSLLFKYPDIFKTGVSVAPVTDLLLYDSIYEERYMGLPSENPEGYKNGSPVNSAAGLVGNLLLIHGTGDDNVHYQNSEVLVNKLIENNKLFSFMPYPNRTHSIKSGKNTRLHLFETITRFLIKNLSN